MGVTPYYRSGLLPAAKENAARNASPSPRAVSGQQIFLQDLNLSNLQLLPGESRPTHHGLLQGVTS